MPICFRRRWVACYVVSLPIPSCNPGGIGQASGNEDARMWRSSVEVRVDEGEASYEESFTW
eukprot:8969637-Pyramimonas_sp.AAC.1